MNAALAGLIFLAALGGSCRGRSEKDIVAGVIADMAARVEKKDTAGLIALLSTDYRDFAGRDREQTRAMADEYFRRYRGIKTKLLATRIAMDGDGSAAVEFDVSLYSGVASALRKAVGFDGENYRVACRLRREGGWRVGEARWESIPLDGLFPESLKILREVFPEL
jgi:hypothetical protein